MDFIAKRKIWFLLSSIIIMAGILSILLQGLNVGIDFTGGNKYMLQFEKRTTTSQIREVVTGFGLENAPIQESGENIFIVRTRLLSEQENNAFLSTLRDKLGKTDVLSNEKVGPVIGKELRRSAFWALLIATILIVGYITVRFQFSFAVAAIAALIHDVLITLSIFSFLQLEIQTPFVAAMLTIIGYSINDTIVVFDRVRENIGYKRKESMLEMVNRSIRQTLTRSINTSLTSIMALLALLILGGETTKVFALAMLIGFIDNIKAKFSI